MQTFNHSLREMKTYWKKFEKMLMVVHLPFPQKQLLMKPSFENQQFYENLELKLMLAKYTPVQCVNPCRPICSRIWISIQRRLESHLDKTRPVTLDIWSSPVYNEQDQNVKLKASALQAYGGKVTISVCPIFFSLQHFVWSNRLFLSLLSLIRSRCISHWARYQTRSQKKLDELR